MRPHARREQADARRAELVAESEYGGVSAGAPVRLCVLVSPYLVVHCEGMGVPVLEMTASARAFQRRVAHAQRMPTHMFTHISVYICAPVRPRSYLGSLF